jgi:hypothetical protein
MEERSVRVEDQTPIGLFGLDPTQLKTVFQTRSICQNNDHRGYGGAKVGETIFTYGNVGKSF